jgi:hypothetical protein
MSNKSNTPAKPRQRRLRPLWSIVLVVSLYAGLWACLAYPYRQFPSDDRRFWSYMSQGSLVKSESGYEPVAEWSMRAFFRLASGLLPPTPCVMGFYTVACYVGVMASIAFLARRIAGDWFTGLLAVFLFAVCAWPVT